MGHGIRNCRQYRLLFVILLSEDLHGTKQNKMRRHFGMKMLQVLSVGVEYLDVAGDEPLSHVLGICK